MEANARAKVSVCVATYNQAPYIKDCVLSVLGQALDAELQVLVGDDGSSDGTGAILEALAERYPHQVILLRRQKNLGPVENYQDLVRRASGDFIAHLDGDDAWLPGKLRTQLSFLSQHPECAAVYTNGIAVDTNGVLRGPFTNAHPPLMSFGYVCAKGNYLMHSSMLYNADHKNAFLDLAAPVIDWGIHLSFARRGPLGFVNEPLALYRVATATSTVRNSYPWVQALLWAALKEAMDSLSPRERHDAVAHFVAEAVIARMLRKTESLQPLLHEIARSTQSTPHALVIRALPFLLVVGGHGALREALRGAGVIGALGEHHRI